MSTTRVLVIGGGGTGAAILHDLVLRGYEATLVERGELTSGTTGRHHGQLHSGARYAVGDREIARECMDEVRILQRIAPQAIEMNHGLFVALDDDDLSFRETFAEACRESGIPARERTLNEAWAMEPALSRDIRAAVEVPDGTLDAWRLPLHFFATARHNGGVVRNFTEVTEVHTAGGAVTGATVRDYRTGSDERLDVDVIVNATGAWAGTVAAMAGIDVPVTPAPGTMVAVRGRLTNMVISRLHPAGDGDILVPQRRLTIIGSTQWRGESADGLRPPREDIEFLNAAATRMVPSFGDAPFHAAWTAARPLAGRASTDADGRSLSRDFIAIDHGSDDGVSGFVTVIGGKATVLRAMGEKTVDMVGRIAGNDAPCATAATPLLPYRSFYKEVARG